MQGSARVGGKSRMLFPSSSTKLKHGKKLIEKSEMIIFAAFAEITFFVESFFVDGSFISTKAASEMAITP
jgi:hypothetical protein